ncbi:MAG: competence/damage-inducible protein A [Actinobacteria bacterium]|nr:competence/damage-inducible protein A [Actinomycetota bacterium]
MTATTSSQIEIDRERRTLSVEIVAVGTELLLGQIADTNSAWLGVELALIGAESHFHQAVGDNHERIVLAIRTALARSDAVVVCGGLGPTQDDITRAAIASVMNVSLERHEDLVERISKAFADRGREMPENNLAQADVPRGASVIPQTLGTAPGLICPLGGKVIYALPGVPYEMSDMFERGVKPDLLRRLREAGNESVIASRVMRTWGTSESALAEALAGRFAAIESGVDWKLPRTTIAFLASGIEGLKVRVTARATTAAAAEEALERELGEIQDVLHSTFGDVVFSVDDESMEEVVARLLDRKGLSLGVAESLTGGMIASRLVGVAGASRWFRGGVVSYASSVKHSILGVPDVPVVSEAAAAAMAEGARRVLGADVGVGVTGVAGPDDADGQPPGTVFVGVSLPDPTTQDPTTEVRRLNVPGDRERVRQYSVISALDLLRRTLSADGAN